MQTDKNEVKAHESIIQTLTILKDEAVASGLDEAEAIDSILNALSALHDDMCKPDLLVAS